MREFIYFALILVVVVLGSNFAEHLGGTGASISISMIAGCLVSIIFQIGWYTRKRN